MTFSLLKGQWKHAISFADVIWSNMTLLSDAYNDVAMPYKIIRTQEAVCELERSAPNEPTCGSIGLLRMLRCSQ